MASTMLPQRHWFPVCGSLPLPTVLLVASVVWLPAPRGPGMARLQAATVDEQLRTGLAEPDAEMRLEAIQAAVVELPPVELRDAVTRGLMLALDDPVPDVRSLAAQAIGVLGRDAEAAVPKLMSKLRDTGVNSRLQAVWVDTSQALGQIGPAALDPLLGAIDGSDRLTYLAVMNALAAMANEASPAVPRLIELLRTGVEDRRWATIYALYGIGAAAEPAVPELVKQLDHEDFNVQCIACRALAKMGPAARPALPKLLRLIEHGLVSARGQAAICLGALGPVEGVDSVGILTALLPESDQITRERVMQGLGRLGPAAVPAADVVRQALQDDDFWPQAEAAKTLWRITGDAGPAVEKLVQLLEDRSRDMRALEVLAEMGPDAAAAAPRLGPLLAHEDQGIRLLAAQALLAMGPAARGQREALAACLADCEPDVAQVVRAAIARMAEGEDPHGSGEQQGPPPEG
jgi:HEAT repeat protein